MSTKRQKSAGKPRRPGAHHPTPNDKESFGRYLAFLRQREGYTLRELAKLAGVKSYAYLGAIERDEARPSAEIIERIAKGMGSDNEELAALKQAADESQRLIAPPGLPFKARKLTSELILQDVAEIWIIAEHVLELDREDYVESTARNLKRGCGYTYFAANPAAWERLRRLLWPRVPQKSRSHFTCIQVPAILQPFIYSPPFAIYVKKGGLASVFGTFALEGAYSGRIVGANEMNRRRADALYAALSKIVEQSKYSDQCIWSSDPEVTSPVLFGPAVAHSTTER